MLRFRLFLATLTLWITVLSEARRSHKAAYGDHLASVPAREGAASEMTESAARGSTGDPTPPISGAVAHSPSSFLQSEAPSQFSILPTKMGWSHRVEPRFVWTEDGRYCVDRWLWAEALGLPRG